jgi:hypothetical protein
MGTSNRYSSGSLNLDAIRFSNGYVIYNGYIIGSLNGYTTGSPNGDIMGSSNHDVTGSSDHNVTGSSNQVVTGSSNGDIDGSSNGNVASSSNHDVTGSSNGYVTSSTYDDHTGSSNGDVPGSSDCEFIGSFKGGSSGNKSRIHSVTSFLHNDGVTGQTMCDAKTEPSAEANITVLPKSSVTEPSTTNDDALRLNGYGVTLESKGDAQVNGDAVNETQVDLRKNVCVTLDIKSPGTEFYKEKEKSQQNISTEGIINNYFKKLFSHHQAFGK